MKKLLPFISIIVLLTVAGSSDAQVVEVCAGDGTDSVTLTVSNYQYGLIQWQWSEDMLVWKDVPGAHDTVLHCKPTTECYYRVWMEYPNCPADSSQISHILFNPKAVAGPDRLLNEGFVAKLFANEVPEARCWWRVLEGDSASLEDPTNPHSHFTGPDTLYKLSWTVANACGVSSDTVEIRYRHTVYYDAIAIVDTTDIILSDSSEMASGLCRVIFSNPAPTITDSTVLIGLVGEGFLRKVVYFDYLGDTCVMYTRQASFEDLLVEGVINYEGPLSSGGNLGRGIPLWHRYTRAELLQDPRFQSGQLMFYSQSGNGHYRPVENTSLINFSTPGLSIEGGWSVDNFSVSMDLPDFIWEFEKKRGGIKKVVAGFMGEIVMDFTVHAIAGSVSADFDVPVAAFPIPIGAVVITPAASVHCEISASLQSQSAVDIPVHFTIPLDLVITYMNGMVSFVDSSLVTVGSAAFDVLSNLQSVTYELSLAVGPKVSVKLYGVVGPFIDAMGKVALSVCNGNNGFMSQSQKLSVVGDFGLEAKIIELLTLTFSKRLEKVVHEFYIPNSIRRYTNTNLFCMNDSFITEPVKVQVFDAGNNPHPFSKVLFQPLNGGTVAESLTGSVFTSHSVLTDANGIASLYWKPGTAPRQLLKANLFDCNNNHMQGSPVIFQANTTQDCANSTLTLQVHCDDNAPMVPQASNGAGGYTYSFSTDGVNFQPYTPTIPVLGVDYEFLVEDANGCVAGSSYRLKDPCEEAQLILEYEISEYFGVGAKATRGIPPYFYTLCNDVDTLWMQSNLERFVYFTPNSPSNHDILFLDQGDYTLSVVDSRGCQLQTGITVHAGDYKPTVALYNITDITTFSAKVQGLLLDKGHPETNEWGVCWSMNGAPTYYSDRIVAPTPDEGSGLFEVTLPDLMDEQRYWVRVYAKSTDFIAFSDTVSFTTLGLPWVHVEAVTQVSVPTAQVNCRVITDGGAPVTERGLCWSTSPDPALGGAVFATEDNMVSVLSSGGTLYVTNGDGTGPFTCNIGGLSGNTTYYLRAYAINAGGTGYSSQDTFTTPISVPTVITSQPTNVSNAGAICGGDVITDGGSPVTERGVCWSTSHNPTINDNHTSDSSGTGGFTSSLTGLSSEMLYYVRAYATNGVGTAYGDELSFTTMPIIVPSFGSAVLTTCDDWIYDNGGSTGNYANNSDGYMVVYPAITGNLVELSGSYQIENGYDNLYVYDGVGISGTLLSTLTGTGTVTSIVSQSGPLTIRFVSDFVLNYSGFALHAQCADPVVPTVITDSVSNITSSSAISGGAVTATGGETVTARGVCWSTSPNPTINGNHTTDGANTGTFVSQITGLQSNITYYVRAYATNSVGTAYGNEVNFTTMPVIVPSSGSDVLITCDDWIYDNGGETGNYANNSDGYLVIYPSVEGMLVSLSGSYQIESCCDKLYVYDSVGTSGTLLNTISGNGTLTDLVSHSGPLTIRFVSDNSLNYSGFALHVQCAPPTVPIVTTGYVYNITAVSAECGGEVLGTGGETVTARGVCWSTTLNPTVDDYYTVDGANTGAFSSHITGLDTSVTYYVRAYATNSVGTAYGDEVNFTTASGDREPCPGAPTVVDFDGNVYNTIKLGQQCWMKENLRTTHYADGIEIPALTSSGSSPNNTLPFRFTPDHNENDIPIYGYRYNWFAVMHGASSSSSNPSNVQGICPVGWHVPSSDEWTQLINYVSSVTDFACAIIPQMTFVYGKALASNTTDWWNSGSQCSPGYGGGGNNSTHFTLMPAGYNHYNGYGGNGYGYAAYQWSSTECSNSQSYRMHLFYNATAAGVGKQDKQDGLSVRCLRD